VNINPFQDKRAVILRFYNKRLSQSRAIEQNQENPMGAGWTAYHILEKHFTSLQVQYLRYDMF
jgi:hypothetical protein